MSTFSHGDYEAAVDSAIRTRRDLLAILPPTVADIVKDGLHLATPDRCAALRLLAAIRNDGWWAAVGPYEIKPWELLAVSAARFYGKRENTLIKLAAQFLTWDLQVRLPVAMRHLDEDEDFLVFVDALRLSREGLES